MSCDLPRRMSRHLGWVLTFAGAFLACQAATLVPVLVLTDIRLSSQITAPIALVGMVVGTAFYALGLLLRPGKATLGGLIVTAHSVLWLALAGYCVASDSVGLVGGFALVLSPIGALLIAIGQTMREPHLEPFG